MLFESEIKKQCPPLDVIEPNRMQWGRLKLVHFYLFDGTFFMHLSNGQDAYVNRYHSSLVQECVDQIQKWIRWFK